MGTNQRFHQSQNYYLTHVSSLLSKGIETERITKKDRELIEEYINEIVAVSSISPTRRYKLVGILIRNREFHPPYSECSITDIYSAIDKIKTATDENGKPRYTKNTISDQIQLLKRFFVWLSESGYSEINLNKLKKIKVPRFDRNTVTAEMILSEQEVKSIIEAATTTRDRALLSVLYEGAFRIGEIANMRWCDVNFTPWNMTINTAEKTGKPRYVSLVASRSFLAQWKNDYPLPIKPESFVFLTTTTKKPLQYNGLVKQIRVLAERAGIKKHINPHIFRHSRITHLIQQGAKESIVKLMCWGDINTDMLKVYQHLTNSDIDGEMAKLNGVVLHDEESDKRKRAMKPIQCKECGTINSPTMKFCGTCGAPLTEEGAAKSDVMTDEIRRLMSEDPAFMMEIFTAIKDIADKNKANNSEPRTADV